MAVSRCDRVDGGVEGQPGLTAEVKPKENKKRKEIKGQRGRKRPDIIHLSHQELRGQNVLRHRSVVNMNSTSQNCLSS